MPLSFDWKLPLGPGSMHKPDDCRLPRGHNIAFRYSKSYKTNACRTSTIDNGISRIRPNHRCCRLDCRNHWHSFRPTIVVSGKTDQSIGALLVMEAPCRLRRGLLKRPQYLRASARYFATVLAVCHTAISPWVRQRPAFV
jgi:hypothetical protein